MKFGAREAVFMVLLLAIPLASWWFVFRPRNAREAETMRQIEAKQTRLRALNYATGTIGDLKKEIQSLEKAVAFFQSRLPNEKEIDKVLNEVSLLAETNHLVTKSIRPLQRAAEDTFSGADAPQAEQPIVMQLEGDFIGFYTFLQALENQPRIMRIRGMKLKKQDKAPQGVVQANIEMSIFFERSNKNQPWPPKT